MGRRKQPPEYFEARRALNQHLYRHHGTTGLGTLSDRLDTHEDLHIVARRIGQEVGHSHKLFGEGETDIEIAWRVLHEGEEQCGSTPRPGQKISIAMDTASKDRRARRKREGQSGQADTAGH